CYRAVTRRSTPCLQAKGRASRSFWHYRAPPSLTSLLPDSGGRSSTTHHAHPVSDTVRPSFASARRTLQQFVAKPALDDDGVWWSYLMRVPASSPCRDANIDGILTEGESADEHPCARLSVCDSTAGRFRPADQG